MVKDAGSDAEFVQILSLSVNMYPSLIALLTFYLLCCGTWRVLFQYFIGVTMIAMIPELPEIVNGIQFALQNNVNLGYDIYQKHVAFNF